MAAAASQLSFEVLRFGAEPVSSEVGLLELEGRFRAGTRRRLGVPRLVAEDADGSREIAPAGAPGDGEVRLAREANALRRPADEARDAAAAALASAGAERSARDAAEAEL